VKKLRLIPLLLILLSLPFVAALAQEATPASPTPLLEIVDVDTSGLSAQEGTAALSVNVFDGAQPVFGLGIDDFALSGPLSEVARIVDVVNASDDNLPISVVLVIDSSESMLYGALDQAKAAALLFIDGLSPEDQVAVVDFDREARVAQGFTTADDPALTDAINALRADGTTALYDAALAGVELAAEAPTSRRVVILLSDGNESNGQGGVQSASPRSAAIDAVRTQNVPVYTIALGYGLNNPDAYLQALSGNIEGRYIATPRDEDLPPIFAQLASELRSQYVLTIAFDEAFALDGTEYELILQAETPDGPTNEGTASLRAPIPVPVVTHDAPMEPISEVTTFDVTILADDAIADVQAAIDGPATASLLVDQPEPNIFRIGVNPGDNVPGDYTLTITAIDADGDQGTAEIPFSIAALPSQIVITPDLEGQVISEPVDIFVEAVGQTPPQAVSFMIGDQSVTFDQPPYSITLNPFFAQPGPLTLGVEVLNEGGVSSTASVTFEIAALPPTLEISGIEEGQTLEGSFAGETLPLTITVTSQTAVESVTVNGMDAEAGDESGVYTFELDPLMLGSGAQTLEIRVENAGGQSATVSIPFSVQIIPTATPTPTRTPTATATPTATPTATINRQATANAQATSQARAAQSTSTAQARVTATAGARSTGTAQAEGTRDAERGSTEAAFGATATQASFEADLTATDQAGNMLATAQSAAATATAESASMSATLDGLSTQAAATQSAQITLDADNAVATQNAVGTEEGLSAQNTVQAEMSATAERESLLAGQTATASFEAEITAAAQTATAETDALEITRTQQAENAFATAQAAGSTATAESSSMNATLDALNTQAVQTSTAASEATATTIYLTETLSVIMTQTSESAAATATERASQTQAARTLTAQAEATEQAIQAAAFNAQETSTAEGRQERATQTAQSGFERTVTAIAAELIAAGTQTREAELTEEALQVAQVSTQAAEDSEGTIAARTATAAAAEETEVEPTPTVEETPAAEVTEAITAEATPTEEETPEAPQTTPTPIVIEDIEAQAADTDQTDLLPFILIGIAVLLVLIILVLVFARRRNE